MKPTTLIIAAMLLIFPVFTSAGEAPAVYFISPQDGAVVSGDYAHIPHDPPVISEKITITVSPP